MVSTSFPVKTTNDCEELTPLPFTLMTQFAVATSMSHTASVSRIPSRFGLTGGLLTSIMVSKFFRVQATTSNLFFVKSAHFKHNNQTYNSSISLRILPRVMCTAAINQLGCTLSGTNSYYPTGTPAIPQVCAYGYAGIFRSTQYDQSLALLPTLVFLPLLYVDNNFVNSSTDVVRSCPYAAQES
jgi:hypothetical protein